MLNMLVEKLKSFGIGFNGFSLRLLSVYLIVYVELKVFFIETERLDNLCGMTKGSTMIQTFTELRLLIIEKKNLFFLWCNTNKRSAFICAPLFCWVNRECAAEISLSKHVHHYPFIRTYCLFTVAPFPESPKAGRWSGKLWTKAFLPHPPGPQKCSPLSRHRAFHRAFGRPWVTVESPRTFPKYRRWVTTL